MSDVQGADAPEPASAETEARNLGWVGKDEFRGDPDKWRPAEEFLDRGKRILPIVLKDNERLQRNLNRIKDEIREIKDSTKNMVEFHTAAAKREYERGKAEIEARIATAASNADPAAATAAAKELDALNKQHTPAPKPAADTTPKADPVVLDWIDKNPWFNSSRALNGFALESYEEIKREKPGMEEGDILAEVKRRTSEKYPEKFGINPKRDGAAAVASPNGSGASRPAKKSYENLPTDAKRACDKFVKTIPGYTKEKYVADYDWGDA